MVDVGDVMTGLRAANMAKAWADFGQVANLQAYMQEDREQGVRRTRTLTYFHWFKSSEERWPEYLKGLPGKRVHNMMKQLARFRLGCHGLQVETGRHNGVAWQDRHCTRCSANRLGMLACKVGDEHHMVFDCSAFDDLRATVPGVQQLIDNAGGSLKAFMSGDMPVVRSFIAACLDKLTAERLGDENAN